MFEFWIVPLDAFPPAARFTFCAVVAVDEFPTNVPKKFVAVAAVADKFPENRHHSFVKL